MNNLILPTLAAAAEANKWTFDLLSALIGAIVTAIAAILVYKWRAALGRAWQATQAQVRQLLDQLAAGVEKRYYDSLQNYLNTRQVLPLVLPLEALYVAPRFVTPIARPSLVQDSLPPPQHVILGSFWSTSRRLIITGRPGSGRTALLIHLARTFITQNLQGSYDPNDRQIPIYANLTELVQRLPTEIPPTAPAPDAAKPKPDQDPAVLLIANVTSHVSALIAGNVGNSVRYWLRGAQALVLLDGLDELSLPDQARAMEWIARLVEQYPQPRYVVSGPPRGYGRLSECGFAALALAEWDLLQTAELAQRWSKAFQRSDEETRRLAAALQPPAATTWLPLDAVIAARVWHTSGSLPPTPSATYGQLVDSLLEQAISSSPHPENIRLSPLLSRGVLGRLATTLLKEGRSQVARAEVEKVIAEILPVEISPIEPATPSPAGQPPVSKAPKGTAESIEMLIQSGLLVAHGHEMYSFPHHRIQTYLAAWNLAQFNDIQTLLERLDDPRWAEVFEFCAGLMNMAMIVDAYLKREDDLFRTRLWTVARWAAASPADAPWRGRALGEMARVWLQPDQLPPLRQRALLGLVSTQDKGLPYLFKKNLKHPDPVLRAQATRGLGLIGKEADLVAFMNSLGDADAGVRQAAVEALGNISSPTAIEGLVDILLEADEDMRMAAAEALARQGEKGKNILRDATKDQDLLVRRAAAHGLGYLSESWAIELLEQLERNDSQWLVRSAATDALRMAKQRQTSTSLNLSPIKLEAQGWLVEWGATRGLSVGLGRSALPVLFKAMTEGDAAAKLAAMRTLAYIGGADEITPLRQALRDANPTIQQEALRAIQEISARTGQTIPA